MIGPCGSWIRVRRKPESGVFGTEGREKELLCEFLIAAQRKCTIAVVSNSTSYLPKVLEVSEVYVKSKDSFPCLFSLSSLIRASSSGF